MPISVSPTGTLLHPTETWFHDDGAVVESGLDLAGAYYREVVAPLLAVRFPGLPHAAARLGSGSDVLGLDDAMSRDHDWGPRLTLLVSRPYVEPIDEYLHRMLPENFAGLPTRFATTWDPTVRHRVEVDTPADFAVSRLGLEVGDQLSPLDWLSFTGQGLLEVTAGKVFSDTHGGISDIRRRLAWYPDDVWRYVVAADWSRLGQELPLMGRTGHRGDEVGSRTIAGRLAHTAMHLGFLLERRWAPYPKWLGTAFARLSNAASATSALLAAQTAATWQERETALCDALASLHDLHRRVGLHSSSRVVEPFFDRPFRTVSGTIVEALISSITDHRVRQLPVGVGSIEQWVDNVNVLSSPALRSAAADGWREALIRMSARPESDVRRRSAGCEGAPP